MRPGESSSIILEGRRDRRYAKAAAQLIGNQAMSAHIDSNENYAWHALYRHKLRTITDEDITNGRLWGYALEYKFTEFKSREDVAVELAQNYANQQLQIVDTVLAPEYVAPFEDGLRKIVGWNTLQATAHFVRRSVAAEMLAIVEIVQA